MIINEVLTIKTHLKKGDAAWALAMTEKNDIMRQMRQANGIRFKARGDGKSWHIKIQTKDSNPETSWACYEYVFETVYFQVVVIDIPYSSLVLPDWAPYPFPFDRETIKNLAFVADPLVQTFGSSLLQIFDFEIY